MRKPTSVSPSARRSANIASDTAVTALLMFLSLLIAAPAGAADSPQLGRKVTETPNLGRVALPQEIAKVDISVLAEAEAKLPEGKGTVAQGERVFAEKCIACHGERGHGGPMDALTGGVGSLGSAKPIKTVNSYWPYATGVFDYIRRTMPLFAPQSLSSDEVYAVTAYVLSIDGIVPADAVLDAQTLPLVQMPNRNGFVSWWPQVSVAPASLDADCDAACLRDLAGRFVESLVAHDPQWVPMTPRFRYTENTIPLPPGQALWATASKGPGESAFYVPDPVTGQIGFTGVLEENGSPVLLAFRMKVQQRKAAEIETLVVRATSALFQPEGLSPVNPDLLRVIPRNRRLPREEMFRIGDTYFRGIENDSSEGVPFHEKCRRVENGVVTAQDPSLTSAWIPRPGSATAAAAAFAGLQPGRLADCKRGFDSKAYSYVAEIAPRRWFALDEEHGIVMAMAIFREPGTTANAWIAGAPRNLQLTPAHTMVTELFRIEEGTIRDIVAVGIRVPYGAGSGWDP